MVLLGAFADAGERSPFARDLAGSSSARGYGVELELGRSHRRRSTTWRLLPAPALSALAARGVVVATVPHLVPSVSLLCHPPPLVASGRGSCRLWLTHRWSPSAQRSSSLLREEEPTVERVPLRRERAVTQVVVARQQFLVSDDLLRVRPPKRRGRTIRRLVLNAWALLVDGWVAGGSDGHAAFDRARLRSASVLRSWHGRLWMGARLSSVSSVRLRTAG